MGIDRKLAAIGLASSLVLVGAGCGKAADKAAEKVAEKAAESATGGDVDIDSDGNSVKITDKDGNTFEADTTGDGATLPDGWPSNLAPPDDVKIVTASTNTINGNKTMVVLASAEGTVEEWAGGLKAQLEDAGYEIQNDATTSGSEGSYAGLTATGDYEMFASISDSSTDEGSVDISITLSEPTS
ncbi:MAG: hypothetical protein R2702_02145 [Acidimicrobiales bacterium]